MAIDKDKKPIALTRADGMRIRKVVQDYERGFQNDLPLRTRYPVGKGPAIRRATLTTTLTARSGSTPGTGTATLRVFDGTVTSDLTATVTVRNDFTSSVASGKVIAIVHTDGAWWVLSADC
jgi:hypothetical protein